MKGFLKSTRGFVSTTIETIRAFWNGPYWWMVPMVILLLMASIVFIALQAAPLISPFVYSLF